MSSPGGEGTFYAGAITAAQANLKTNGRAGAQHVIILLSDGDATASGSQISSSLSTNECGEAVTAATNATKAGDIIMTIAYGSSTVKGGKNGSCSSDNGTYSGCSALTAMASQPKWFFSDTQGVSGGCPSSATSVTDLVDAFGQAATSLGTPRLLPDNTQ